MTHFGLEPLSWEPLNSCGMAEKAKSIYEKIKEEVF